MLLTVFCLRRDRSELTFSLQVDADFELQNFRALCELESGIPAAESQIVYAAQPLTDNHRSLASYGLKDGDVVILQQMENAEAQPPGLFPSLPRIDFGSISVPGPSSLPAPQPPEPQAQPSPPELPNHPHGLDNPALLRDMLLANPHELSLLKERNPPLAEALLSGDLERFTRVLVEQQQDRARREQERIRLFSADPFDLDAQAKIEEDIRQQNIEENMTIAMEEAPESFGQVVMLYINCKVNGHPVKAFVDSGAQMTIMSQACAERCNIMRLVDRRWAGIAKGVGTQKIIGRIHLAQVQIEGDFLPCSFSILEEQPMDMLLGLDMLKRHQCSIDLKKNVLVIGTTGSQTSFLPEGELPECARLAYGAGREDMRPEEMADRELAEALQKSVEEAENSDRETTSLETPSVPTSEGLNCPVRLPEVGPQTNDPSSRRLDCLVSPPPPPPATTTATTTVCSQESSQAESVNLWAVKPVDSLHELPATLESKELLPLQRKLPEDVASANARTSLAEEAGKTPCRSPRIPPRTISGKTFVWGNLRKPDDAQYDAFDAEPPDGLGGQGASSETCSQAEELDIPLLMEQVEEPHVGLFKAHTKPKHGQNEPNSSEHLCPMALSPLPAPAELSPDGFFSEGRAGIEWERRISPAKKRRPEEVGPRGGEVFMDVVAREPFVATDSLFTTSGATQPGADAECSRMEVETSSHPPSLPLSSPPVSGLTQRGGAASESTDGSAMMGLMGAPSGSHLSDQMEEPCISLTSALKELHQLLVVNSKQDVDVSQPEDLPPSISVPQEQATGHEVHHGKREPTYLDIPASGYTGTESSVKRQMFEAAGEGTHVTEMHKLTVSHEQAMLTVQGTSAVDSSGFLSPPAFSGQVQGGEHVEETLSQRPSSSHILLSSEASEQSFSLGQSQGSQSSFSESMETSSTPGTRFQRLMNGLLDSSPLLPLDGSPLSVTHAEEINHLVGDGFTPQEATEALERAGGNLELALLILLAKSIVVPT